MRLLLQCYDDEPPISGFPYSSYSEIDILDDFLHFTNWARRIRSWWVLEFHITFLPRFGIELWHTNLLLQCHDEPPVSGFQYSSYSHIRHSWWFSSVNKELGQEFKGPGEFLEFVAHSYQFLMLNCDSFNNPCTNAMMYCCLPAFHLFGLCNYYLRQGKGAHTHHFPHRHLGFSLQNWVRSKTPGDSENFISNS